MYAAPIDVLLILTRDDKILLAERAGGYAHGQLNVPSGKLEDREDALTAMARETREEIGLHLTPAQLRHVATVHYRSPEGQGRLGLFFSPKSWTGEPVNAEPHKCAGLLWHPIHQALPGNTVPYTAAGIHCYRTGLPFLVHGW